MAGSIIGGLFGMAGAKKQAKAAEKAAEAQVEAARIGADTQREMFDTSVSLGRPWRTRGQNALAALSYELGLGPHPTFMEAPEFIDANDPDALGPSGDGSRDPRGGGQGNALVNMTRGGDGTWSAGTTPKGYMVPQFDPDQPVISMGNGGQRQMLPDDPMFSQIIRAPNGDVYRVAGMGGTATPMTVALVGPDGKRVDVSQDQLAKFLQGDFSVVPGQSRPAPAAAPAPSAPPSGGFRYQGFQHTPGFQHNLDEGQKAINRSLAARGGVLSGSAVKEGMRFGQGLANQEYGNHLARLAALSGVGGGFASSAGQQAVQTGGNIANTLTAGARGQGDYLTQAGNARASGYAALGQGIGQGANALAGFLGNKSFQPYGAPSGFGGIY